MGVELFVCWKIQPVWIRQRLLNYFDLGKYKTSIYKIFVGPLLKYFVESGNQFQFETVVWQAIIVGRLHKHFVDFGMLRCLTWFINLLVVEIKDEHRILTPILEAVDGTTVDARTQFGKRETADYALVQN